MQSSTVMRAIWILQLQGWYSDTSEFLEQRGMPLELARRFEANAAGDRDQVLQGVVEVIVHDYIVERLGMSDVVGGGGQSAFDHLVAVLAARGQTGAQRIERRRQDENRRGLREMLPHLFGTLPVDFQQDVMAGVEVPTKTALRCAVIVAVY